MNIERLNNYIRDGGDPNEISIEIDPSFRQNASIEYFSLLEERRRKRNGKQFKWIYRDPKETNSDMLK